MGRYYLVTPQPPLHPVDGAAFTTFTTFQDISPAGQIVLPQQYLEAGVEMWLEADGEFSNTLTPDPVPGVLDQRCRRRGPDHDHRPVLRDRHRVRCHGCAVADAVGWADPGGRAGGQHQRSGGAAAGVVGVGVQHTRADPCHQGPADGRPGPVRVPGGGGRCGVGHLGGGGLHHHQPAVVPAGLLTTAPVPDRGGGDLA